MPNFRQINFQVIKDANAGPDEKYGPGSQYTGVALLDTIDGTELHFQFVMNEDRDGKKSRIIKFCLVQFTCKIRNFA